MQTPSGARDGSESSSRAGAGAEHGTGLIPSLGDGSGSTLLSAKVRVPGREQETGASLLLQAAPGGDM